MDIHVSRLSSQLIGMEVEYTNLLGQPQDPTGYDVRVAVVPVGQEPLEADLRPGVWRTSGGRHVACSQRGPAEFAAGLRYRVWAKVLGSPETPVLRSPDRLVIY